MINQQMSPQPRNDDASDVREPEEEEEEEEEEELLKLEEEVETMAQRILEFRDTLPDQLSSTISSLLASQRPVLPTHLVQPESGPTQDLVRPVESENTALVIIEEPEEAEKIKLLKQKIASNASTMPTLLNRMREYMGRIDKLESSNGVIHPAFKRKRTN